MRNRARMGAQQKSEALERSRRLPASSLRSWRLHVHVAYGPRGVISRTHAGFASPAALVDCSSAYAVGATQCARV